MWQLDVKDNRNHVWRTICEKKTADQCKTAAREYHRSSSDKYSVVYRIYALSGDQLAYCSHSNGWRLKWLNGNLKPRSDQAT